MPRAARCRGWLTQGPKVAAFEKAFAERHRVSHALAATSCTTALHLMLAAVGIGPGDEVIVPAFTWVATANVVVYCGATPVFVDVDPDHLQHRSRRCWRGGSRRERRRSSPSTCSGCAPTCDGDPRRGAARRADRRGLRLRRRRQPRWRARRRPRRCRRLLVSSAQVDHHRRRRHADDERRRACRRWPISCATTAPRVRGAAPCRAEALPAARVQPARLQLSDDRSAGRGRPGAASQARPLRRRAPALGRALPRRAARTSPGCACRSFRQRRTTPGRPLSPMSIPRRRRCRATRSWSGCRPRASRRARARTPCTCWVSTAIASGFRSG